MVLGNSVQINGTLVRLQGCSILTGDNRIKFQLKTSMIRLGLSTQRNLPNMCDLHVTDCNISEIGVIFSTASIFMDDHTIFRWLAKVWILEGSC